MTTESETKPKAKRTKKAKACDCVICAKLENSRKESYTTRMKAKCLNERGK